MNEDAAGITVNADVRNVLTDNLIRVLARFRCGRGVDLYSVELSGGRKLNITCLSDGPRVDGTFTVVCAAWLGPDIDHTLDGSHLDAATLAKMTGCDLEVTFGAGRRGTVLKCTPVL